MCFQLFSRDWPVSVSGAYVRKALWPGGIWLLLCCSGPLCLWGRRCSFWTSKSPLFYLYLVGRDPHPGQCFLLWALKKSLFSAGCDRCPEAISSGSYSYVDRCWLCECSRRSLSGVQHQQYPALHGVWHPYSLWTTGACTLCITFLSLWSLYSCLINTYIYI